jgi:hypothetical protein
MAGERARVYTLILLLLWPYGCHFGRLAGWYSFTFLLVASLTLTYLRYVEHPSPRNLDAGSAVRVGTGVHELLRTRGAGLSGPCISLIAAVMFRSIGF